MCFNWNDDINLFLFLIFQDSIIKLFFQLHFSFSFLGNLFLLLSPDPQSGCFFVPNRGLVFIFHVSSILSVHGFLFTPILYCVIHILSIMNQSNAPSHVTAPFVYLPTRSSTVSLDTLDVQVHANGTRNHLVGHPRGTNGMHMLQHGD